jgi:hypothetical protein
MSLFEWFGERRNPGPVGGIDSGHPDPGHFKPRVIMVRGAIAVMLVAGVLLLIFRGSSGVEEMVSIAAIFAFYCGIAYSVTPRPNYDNIGWAGGLVDNPFRYSDDMNRMLVGLLVFLWPGRFITVGLRDLFQQARGRRIMLLPPRD